jgi:hypothetical protein
VLTIRLQRGQDARVLGRRIGDRFVVERLVAEGGMGFLYRARDLHTDGEAAIKVARDPGAQADERFAREARVLAELRHPAIVEYLTHGRTDEGALFLAMEWLEGEDLGQRLRSRELTAGETLRLATQVAAALAVAHARRIVHRDVKPANLFLVDDRVERVKVLDFGVARIARLASLTLTGAVVGTPRYMAPEQARGDRDVDARADVFALGVLLYRCLSGREAFGGDTPAEVMRRILDDEPPPLSAPVPGELAALVRRMLDKDPAARPADAAAVLAELLAFDLTPPAGAPPRELGAAERRLECVVAIDVQGEEVGRVAAAHGGVPGDGGAIAIAAPGLPSDHARAGARLALALRRRFPQAAISVGMGRAPAGAAPGGAVRIDEAIAGLLGPDLDVRGDGEGLLLGRAGAEGEGRLPFVGRDIELAQLEAIFDGCVRDGDARVVLVSGPAGQGKSRLRIELLRRLRGRGEDLEVWLGRGDPMHAGAPYGLLGDAIRAAAGITGDEPLAERRRRLEDRVGLGRAAAELVGEIAGVPFPSEESTPLRAARRDPAVLSEKVRAAFCEWLAVECARRPLLLVLEDLHWGDVPTVKLVNDALAALADRPLLVLAVSRPEIHALMPALWADRGLHEIHLGPLPGKGAARLVRQVLGEADTGRVAAIVERAAGNAFFLEELVRHVAERRAGFPETVLAMAAARFEALSPAGRRALRAASVFGEGFTAEHVAALLGDERAAGPALDELLGRELVERRGAELRFRHSLLREAAYALLTEEDRVLGHALAGELLARGAGGDALVVAEHLERGRRPDAAAGWFRRAAEQALAGGDLDAAIARAERGVAAGARGEELGALRLAQALAHRMKGELPRTLERSLEAAALLPRGGEGWVRATTEAAVASAMRERLDEALAEPLFAAAEEGPIGAALAIGLGRVATQCALGRGSRATFHRAAERLAALPAALSDDHAVQAVARQVLAYRASYAGRPEECHAHLVEAERHLRLAGDERGAVMQRLDLVGFDVVRGRLAQADAELEALRGDAVRLGMPMAARFASLLRAGALVDLGRSEEALAVATELNAGDARSIGNPRLRCAALGALGNALVACGRLDEGEGRLREAVAFGEAVRPIYDRVLAALVRLLARRGRTDEALALSESLPTEIEVAETLLALVPGELHLARVEACLAAGHDDEARRAAAAARRWVTERIERRYSEATWRECARANPVIAAILRHAGER